MRRKDRQRDAAFALEVLRRAPFATLSLVTPQGGAYGIPVSPAVTEAGVLYFHCALQGEKLDCIRAHPQVCVSAVSQMRLLPEDYSVAYDSAVVTGTARLVEDPWEKREALRLICQRYAPQNTEDFEPTLARWLDRTCIVGITPEHITGKQHLKSE